MKRAVLQTEMYCAKCRTKAMQIAAGAYGVNSVKLEGKEKNQLVVIGEGMDITKLTKRLRDKIGWTQIVSLSEVK